MVFFSVIFQAFFSELIPRYFDYPIFFFHILASAFSLNFILCINYRCLNRLFLITLPKVFATFLNFYTGCKVVRMKLFFFYVILSNCPKFLLYEVIFHFFLFLFFYQVEMFVLDMFSCKIIMNFWIRAKVTSGKTICLRVMKFQVKLCAKSMVVNPLTGILSSVQISLYTFYGYLGWEIGIVYLCFDYKIYNLWSFFYCFQILCGNFL